MRCHPPTRPDSSQPAHHQTAHHSSAAHHSTSPPFWRPSLLQCELAAAKRKHGLPGLSRPHGFDRPRLAMHRQFQGLPEGRVLERGTALTFRRRIGGRMPDRWHAMAHRHGCAGPDDSSRAATPPVANIESGQPCELGGVRAAASFRRFQHRPDDGHYVNQYGCPFISPVVRCAS